MDGEHVVSSLCVLPSSGWQAGARGAVIRDRSYWQKTGLRENRNVFPSTCHKAALQSELPSADKSADEKRVVGYSMWQRGVKQANHHESMIFVENKISQH